MLLDTLVRQTTVSITLLVFVILRTNLVIRDVAVGVRGDQVPLLRKRNAARLGNDGLDHGGGQHGREEHKNARVDHGLFLVLLVAINDELVGEGRLPEVWQTQECEVSNVAWVQVKLRLLLILTYASKMQK